MKRVTSRGAAIAVTFTLGVGVLAASTVSRATPSQAPAVATSPAPTTTSAAPPSSSAVPASAAPCAAMPQELRLLLTGPGGVRFVGQGSTATLAADGLPANPIVAARGPDGTIWVEDENGIVRVGTDNTVTPVHGASAPRLAAVGWLAGQSSAAIVDVADTPYRGSAEERGALLVDHPSGTPLTIGPSAGPEYSVTSLTFAGDLMVLSAAVDLTESISYLDSTGRVVDGRYSPTVGIPYNAPPSYGDGLAGPGPDGQWLVTWVEGPKYSDATQQDVGDWVLASAAMTTGAPRHRLALTGGGESLLRVDFDGRYWVGTFGAPVPTTTQGTAPPPPPVAQRVLAVDLTSPTPAVVDLRCAPGLIATIDRNGTPQPGTPPVLTTPSTTAATAATTVATTVATPTTIPGAPRPTPGQPVINVSFRCGRLVEQPDRYPIIRCRKGYVVYEVQWRLHELGYQLDVDDQFGPETETAVRQFQRDEGLTIDGGVGPSTWRRLLARTSGVGHDTDHNGIVDPWELVYD